MYRGGGGGGGSERPRTAPPDLPSLLLDARICYLGMPIVPAGTELLVAQFMWLDYDNPTKPIYLYINSPGTQVSRRSLIIYCLLVVVFWIYLDNPLVTFNKLSILLFPFAYAM
jgi:hypothetical protein